MTRLDETRLAELMHTAAHDAPSAEGLVQSTVRRAVATRRRLLSLGGIAAVAIPAAVVGILNASPVAATVPAEAKVDLSADVPVSCSVDGRDPGTNHGSPDYSGEGFDMRKPTDQAAAFARGAGPAARFPGIVAKVHNEPSPRTTVIELVDAQGVRRGALQYYGSTDEGWQLVHAWYC